ncbi:FxsB family radical SAM/SPASM domain protein [Streptomyces niveiscabiei]|uniref:FxsB family cyclophane-forming radical SAM/SPASM peptide maturase n=1 Tax=Streptomyces niveiscabiei TaxID=164115 RepID=UPI0029A05EFD|nr:FxsB family cyclophane-forming radical SAM/SPASM peptide maturase [Streptomyces niveiscabiei]MDX3380979.1 FxsB family radical SAM/SPASM domain protein [Streptomyces niveiscabiei]
MTEPALPLRQLVLKVHSRCDLACRHCYVYEHADTSWSVKPRVIAEETVSRVARRLAEHARTHRLASVQVILHGGEPLLAGIPRLRHVCEQLTGALRGVAELDLRIHTNGVQLTTRHLDLFAEYGVRVGVSLDGDRAANDRFRLYRDGRSSHDKVLAALALLDEHPHLYAGILCTVDVRNDPVAVYDALAALTPPRIDFLLPHATWDTPPHRPEGRATPYADWLLAVHARWSERGRPMPVRLFDSVVSTLGGGPSHTEAMGLDAADVVVIDTDGGYEQADSLKTAYDGAPATGHHVALHSFDDVSRHPGLAARREGLAGLSEQCRACPVVRSCGGGLFAHRYRSDGTGFDNPSVYCADLRELVDRLAARTGADATRPVPGFDALADGTDDGTAVRALTEARTAVTLALLGELESELPHPASPLWTDARQRAADPHTLAAVLAHPYTRPWILGCLDGTASPDHLAALVAPAPRLRLRCGGLDIALDDRDPHRDCFGATPHPGLTPDDTTRWEQVLTKAWELIDRALPGTAAAMAAEVRTVTPLTAPPRTADAGPAALGARLDDEPADVAAQLVHCFRLGVLDALLDVCELYDEEDPHIGALLADTYAGAATDEILGTSRVRDQLGELAEHPALTPLGRRFADGIRRSR